MKERNPIQPTAPQIVGDIEDVESIVTSDNEYIFIKKELSPRTLVSQMLVITSYFENNFKKLGQPDLSSREVWFPALYVWQN